MRATVVDVGDIPPLDHDEAMVLAEAEYGRLLERFLGILAGLPDADPFPAPDKEGFEHMLAAITAGAAA